MPSAVRLRECIKNVGLLAGSIVVGLIGIELGLRAVNGQPLWPDQNLVLERANVTKRFRTNQYDPLLGWVMRPGLRIAPAHPNASFTSGELGLRMNSPTIDWNVPRNAILAVGDSFTAGSDVGDAQSWPAQLEQILGKPVLNGASGGWGADQIALRIEDLLPKLTPRIVIASFLENDILRTEYSVYGGGPKPYFVVKSNELVLANVPVPRRIEGATEDVGLARAILGYSYLVDWTMSRLGVQDWFEITPFVKIATDPTEVSCLLLKRLKQQADERKARLIFLMQWGGNAIVQFGTRPHHATYVLGCARDLGIQTVDPWNDLKRVLAGGENNLKPLYIMQQNGTVYGHMTSAGNRFMAELVAAAIDDKDLTAIENAPTGPRAPQTNVPLFGDDAHFQHLTVSSIASATFDRKSPAMLLDDRSRAYGVVYQDLPVNDDDSLHTFSIDIKMGTSSRTQLVMAFTGGKAERIFHTFLSTERATPEGGEGYVAREPLGNGWYRVSLIGPNNSSGNTTLRVHLYPRHGKPEDVGSVYVANARLDP